MAGVERLRAGVRGLQNRATGATRTALDEFDQVAARTAQDLTRVSGSMRTVYGILQGADVVPTTQAVAAWNEVVAALRTSLAAYQELIGGRLTALNVRLTAAGLAGLTRP